VTDAAIELDWAFFGVIGGFLFWLGLSLLGEWYISRGVESVAFGYVVLGICWLAFLIQQLFVYLIDAPSARERMTVGGLLCLILLPPLLIFAFYLWLLVTGAII